MQFAFDDFLKFWFVYNGVYILFFLSVVDLSKTVKKLSPLRSLPAFVVQVLNVLSLKWDKCQAETCTLFVPEEKYTHLMVGYKTKVNKIFKSNNFPYVVAMKWRVCGYLIPLPTRTGRSSGARIRRRRDFLSVRQWKLGSEESKEKSEENRTGFYCKYEA